MPALVIDASVLINFLALEPDHLERVCSVLGELHVAAQVRAETTRDPRTGKPADRRLDDMFASGMLTLVELDSAEVETFDQLVSADVPDDLDDGEAATIAVALHRSMVAAVDETKGLRIAQRCSVRCTSSVAILTRADVLGALGEDAPDALEAALQYARMRIPNADRAAVVELLGCERAANYPLLTASARRRPRHDSK